MAEKEWPNYESQPVEIVSDQIWEVYDPWTAELVGYFYKEEDAKLFAKAYMKREKKKGR